MFLLAGCVKIQKSRVKNQNSVEFQYQQKGVKIQKGVSPFLRRPFFDVPEVTSKDHFI
jgi:hypothetical protein